MSKTDVEKIPFEFKPGIPHLPYEVQLEQHRRRTTNVDVITDHMLWQDRRIKELEQQVAELEEKIRDAAEERRFNDR